MKRVVLILLVLIVGACTKQAPSKKVQKVHVTVCIIPWEVLRDKDYDPQGFDESEES